MNIRYRGDEYDVTIPHSALQEHAGSIMAWLRQGLDIRIEPAPARQPLQVRAGRRDPADRWGRS